MGEASIISGGLGACALPSATPGRMSSSRAGHPGGIVELARTEARSSVSPTTQFTTRLVSNVGTPRTHTAARRHVRDGYRSSPLNSPATYAKNRRNNMASCRVAGVQRWAVFCAALCLAAAACAQPSTDSRTGRVGGRVLLAPGVGLAGANVTVDQVNLYDGKGAVRKHVGDTMTDAQWHFEALPTGTINGLLLFTVSGGTYTDLVSGARIQLDPSRQLKAVHWLGLFEDRSESIYVTPVHAFIEARFRRQMSQLNDTIKAAEDAYTHVGDHFGSLDWDTVIPADLTAAAASPTDEVRASFVLGGLSVLTDDIRTASGASSQDVNLMTVVDAIEQDLSDPLLPLLDGNDGNNPAPGSGLVLGICSPVPLDCVVPPGGCALDACRTDCDLYINTYRGRLAGAVTKFIGSKIVPSVWNNTSLGASDARTLIDGIAGDVDPDLFGAVAACIETADRTPQTIGWQSPTPEDGAFAHGMVTVRMVATDDTDPMPKAYFGNGLMDIDGDLTNSVAVATVVTQMVSDGPVQVTAQAQDRAGKPADGDPNVSGRQHAPGGDARSRRAVRRSAERMVVEHGCADAAGHDHGRARRARRDRDRRHCGRDRDDQRHDVDGAAPGGCARRREQ
jgi:hypothetical protein